MLTTAGSNKRRNIQGHIVVASLEILTLFKRIPSTTLMNYFRQAREQGSAPITLGDAAFTLVRHPDHTYTIEPHDSRNRPML